MRATAISIALVTLAISASASAQTWPADMDWRILFCNGAPSSDPCMDQPGATNERDVVGDGSAPALYFFADDAFFYFRMRVDASPGATGDFNQFGWAVELDSDTDRTTYEILAQVNGTREAVEIHRNTFQRLPDDPGDPAEELIMSYGTDTHARVVEAVAPFASSLCGSPDFFVDWAVDRAVLAAEGITDATAFVLVMGTSSNGEAITADLACHDGATGAPSLTGVGTDPETATGTPVVDTDGDGLIDTEEATRMTNPNNADTDGDGWSDGTEIARGTDPLDPQSFPEDIGLRGGHGGCSAASGDSGAPLALLVPLLLLFTRRRRSAP